MGTCSLELSKTTLKLRSPLRGYRRGLRESWVWNPLLYTCPRTYSNQYDREVVRLRLRVDVSKCSIVFRLVG